jgi:KipI family sensor histidine kinase inhibitor
VIEVRSFGEAALHAMLGDTADAATLPRVHALAAAVEAARDRGEPWGRAVPGMATLLVPFDPHVLSMAEARHRLLGLADGLGALDPPPGSEAREHRIEVRYGGDDGPDLVAVSERLGLAPGRVVELHASVAYRVCILGFMPGFAYLGGLPASLRVPRRDSPRPRVPAGSVAIAGPQTGVYPFASPGGWHLIGRTEARLWRMEDDPPAVLRPGDRVRFLPIA